MRSDVPSHTLAMIPAHRDATASRLNRSSTEQLRPLLQRASCTLQGSPFNVLAYQKPKTGKHGDDQAQGLHHD